MFYKTLSIHGIDHWHVETRAQLTLGRIPEPEAQTRENPTPNPKKPETETRYSFSGSRSRYPTVVRVESGFGVRYPIYPIYPKKQKTPWLWNYESQIYFFSILFFQSIDEIVLGWQ